MFAGTERNNLKNAVKTIANILRQQIKSKASKQVYNAYERVMVKERICLPCQPTNSPPSPGDRNRCIT